MTQISNKKYNQKEEIITYGPDEKWVIIGLIAIYVLLIIWGLLSDATWDDDCATRYYNTREALQNPRQFISLWNRPLFVILFTLPLQLGKHMIVFQMASISILCCYTLYKTALIKQIPNAYLIIPFTAFQAYYFPISFNALAEPLAACIISFGLLFHAQKKYLSFTIIGALLPLARLELSPLLLLWGFILIQQKQWKIIPILVIPTLMWNFAGAYFDGDPMWLYNKTIGAEQSENIYGHSSFWSYFHRYIFVVGPVVFYFMLIGLLENIFKRKIDWIVSIQFIAGFILYVIFSWKLNLGQAAGFLRHLITLSPLAGYLALVGYNYWINSTNNQQQKNRIAIYSFVILITTFLFLSKEIISHHIISSKPEYYKVMIITVLVFIFIYISYINQSIYTIRSVRILIPVFIIVTTMGYTMITEPPNNHDNAEREVMKNISQWYVKNNLHQRKTYANHIWFFYSSDLDKNSKIFNYITKNNLNNAQPSSIIIWESHYSHRLFGDVSLDYFENNSKFQEITRLITPNKQFGVIVFQTVK